MPNAQIGEPVEQERLRLLFRQARTASTVAIVGAVISAAVFFHASPGPAPLIWLGTVLAATLLRLALYRRFFHTAPGRYAPRHWLARHLWSGVLVGLAWGSLPLVPATAAGYLGELQVLVPAFMAMAAITSYGVYVEQYFALLFSTGLATLATLTLHYGTEALPIAALFVVFAPVLMITAKRYSESLVTSLAAQAQSTRLVHELTSANSHLLHQNSKLALQQDLLGQEEALAQHVFRQLTLGGDHKLPGVHAWNQPMGSLSGDLTQTARGPAGQIYVFLGDFTGHGLPAALGALPTSAVFLAMAAKGLPVATIVAELNRKLGQLLPVGYFCCAVLIELSSDRRLVNIWNGGLPPVLIRRAGEPGYEVVTSHSLPLGVVGDDAFDASAHSRELRPGDRVYAYTDGLTEAENVEGAMWGLERLEGYLGRDDLPVPRLPSLIEAVLEYVNLAPASDDISVVEIEATPTPVTRADAA